MSEGEIARGMRDAALGDHLVVEGAAGVAIAGWRALVRERPAFADRPSAVVLCGGNLGADLLARTLVAA